MWLELIAKTWVSRIWSGFSRTISRPFEASKALAATSPRLPPPPFLSVSLHINIDRSNTYIGLQLYVASSRLSQPVRIILLIDNGYIGYIETTRTLSSRIGTTRSNPHLYIISPLSISLGCTWNQRDVEIDPFIYRPTKRERERMRNSGRRGLIDVPKGLLSND